MENLNSASFDADPSSTSINIQHSNLNSTLPNEIPQSDQYSSFNPTDHAEFDNQLWSSLLSPQSPSVELDWSDFNPTPFGIPCPDPNPAPVRPVEMLRFDPSENRVFEKPRIAASPASPPPPSPSCNQTMNTGNGFRPIPLVIPCPDPNSASMRLVEMPRFDPSQNMVFEKSWTAMPPPLPSSSLPRNQTMNAENDLNPTPFVIPCPAYPNPAPMRPVEMPRFDPKGNMVFEKSLPPSSLPCNETMNTENNFRQSGDEYKTKADIICKNYLEAYRADSSSIRTAVDRDCAAAFNTLLNFNNTGLLSDIVKFSSGSEMHLAAAAATTSIELPPPCNEVKAATHGRAYSPERKRKWSVQEHKLLLVGMEIFGKGDWTNIANKVVITKSNTQVSSHAQKYFLRPTLPRKKGKRASIHDITTVDRELLSKVRAGLGLPPSPPLPSSSNE